MTRRQTLVPSALLVVATALAAATPAPAATRLVVKGAGFGHGVGMSQYGAFGFAKKGRKFDEILGHYYTGTRLATLTDDQLVTVLLRSSPSAAFTGASRIGDRELDPGKTYSVKASGGSVVLRSPTGRALVEFTGPVRAPGPGLVQLRGAGPNGLRNANFRGALEFRPSNGRLLVINALGLEDYVRGVVSAESPPSWPIEALKAQAVAARTYAITTNAGASQGFQQWPDTRSQVYRGVAAETTSTDTAVAATARQVVTHLGKPVTTFFFSTSGGRTENVENSFLGAAPQPYLKSVEDPFDDASPKHRWRFSFTIAQAQSKLRGLVKGRFRSIKVLKRGVSPRVVSARVVGSRGTTKVTGPQLRTRLGLFDHWATFTVIGAKVTPSSSGQATQEPAPTPAPAPTGPTAQGGATAATGPTLRSAALSAAWSTARPAAPAYDAVLSGAVGGAKDGDWLKVQRRTATGRYTLAFWTTARGGRGAYRALLPEPGVYRVVWRGMPGPGVVAR